jgi:hypothetical protein
MTKSGGTSSKGPRCAEELSTFRNHEWWDRESLIDSERRRFASWGVEPTDHIGNGGSRMAGVSRRTFLGRGSLAVAAAGVLSSVPGLSGLIGAAETEAPAADATVAGADAGAASLTEPLVAHVRDMSTGEISVFNGTREVIVRDPQLAGRLARAVH